MISIPFSPEMAAAALNGYKCCTTRSKPYGKTGDIFQINGVSFRILDIQQHTLNYVHQNLYRLEGFDTPEAFELAWRILHRGKFTSLLKYSVHFFVRASLLDVTISNPVTGASYPVRQRSSKYDTSAPQGLWSRVNSIPAVEED